MYQMICLVVRQLGKVFYKGELKCFFDAVKLM